MNPQDTDPLRDQDTDREPTRRAPYQGWADAGRHPAGTRVTWFVLGLCIGIVLAVVGMAGLAEAREATPRAALKFPVDLRSADRIALSSGVALPTASGQLGASLRNGARSAYAADGAPTLPAVSAEASEPIVSVPATAVSGLVGSPTGHRYVGVIAYADPSHGPRYLATPEKRGTLVTVCGPLGCVTRTTTDAGPDLSMQRAGRIADVSAVDFETICGPLSMGLCDGTVTVGGDTLPATETKP